LIREVVAELLEARRLALQQPRVLHEAARPDALHQRLQAAPQLPLPVARQIDPGETPHRAQKIRVS
jgi:hypothetical protein